MHEVNWVQLSSFILGMFWIQLKINMDTTKKYYARNDLDTIKIKYTQSDLYPTKKYNSRDDVETIKEYYA
jgi:hypothetical protein